jgi:hypothetical protein
MLERFALLLRPGMPLLRRSTGRGHGIVLVGANLPTRKAPPVIAAPRRLLRGTLPPKKGVLRPDGVAR